MKKISTLLLFSGLISVPNLALADCISDCEAKFKCHTNKICREKCVLNCNHEEEGGAYFFPISYPYEREG